ncbi:MAG: alanine--glyoxylate aminotransferase family protein [Candidatus Altiarchaeota archaeon]|nr:alanine--glyoxylate aminotransferase family protein [Candidatus Altiarchaeota archaeon]
MDFPKLFTAGPVYVRQEIREEMAKQMFSHRSSEYVSLHSGLIPKIQKLLQTQNEVFLYASSATGVWESAARNCVRKKALSCVNGEFSKRFGEVIKANGKEVETLEKKPGQAILPEDLDSALSTTDADAVSIVHNETSTGVMNPLKGLMKVCKEYDVTSLVDVVSSVAGAEVDVDKWGIDVCLFSVQKCLGVPPGLSCASVSEKALKTSESMANKGYYFDMMVLKKYHGKSHYPSTPPIPQIFALSKSLDFLFEEGLQNSWARHRKVSDFVKQRCIKDLKFKLFCDPEYASQTISCIDTCGKNSPEILKKMKEKRYIIASGYGPYKETTFRVGNMGNVYMGDVEEMLEVLEEVVKQF